LYIRKAMIALALAWFGVFILLARRADDFPVLATIFFIVGFLIVPLCFSAHFAATVTC